MIVVFGIIAHKYSSLLHNFVSTLEDENSYFIIHVDKKSDITPFLYLKDKYKNVFFVDNRIDVQWGGRTLIDAEITTMEYANNTIENFDYIFLISGDTLPLCSKETLFRKLEITPSLEYIHIAELKPSFIDRLKYKWPTQQKLNRYSIICRIRRRFKLYKKNPLFYKLPPLYVGFNWVGLTYNSLNYVLEYLKNNPVYYEAFKYASCGDELFIHSIILNSQFKNNINSNGAMFEIWKNNSPHPVLLSEKNIDSLKEAQINGYFFARKFSEFTNINILKKELNY